MAELPPDHARQLLLKRLVAAKIEAERIGATLPTSLIAMAILSIHPTWTGDEPVAQNDNGSSSDKV